jgi:putative membrane protein
MQLTTLGSFLAYFAAALVLTAIFVLLYTWLTPWSEFALIRSGNAAAALSLGGAVLGFVLPLASAIAHSVGFVDMVVWGVLAIVVQILVFLLARLIDGDLKRRIEAGEIATAGKLAIMALATGILNAACMTY